MGEFLCVYGILCVLCETIWNFTSTVARHDTTMIILKYMFYIKLHHVILKLKVDLNNVMQNIQRDLYNAHEIYLKSIKVSTNVIFF